MSEETQLGPTGQGSVVIDIGDNTGALVLYTTSEHAGAEIEISPVGQDDSRTHVAVRERRIPNSTLYAAIYPALSAGTYTLWNLDSTPADTITITGGQVTQHHWK